MFLLEEAKRRINKEIMKHSSTGKANHQYVAGMINAISYINELISEEQDKMHEYYELKSNKLSEL